MVRPSFVLGGRAMEVIHDEEMLRNTWRRPWTCRPNARSSSTASSKTPSSRGRLHRDGKDAFVPAVMEHIELAGIHSAIRRASSADQHSAQAH